MMATIANSIGEFGVGDFTHLFQPVIITINRSLKCYIVDKKIMTGVTAFDYGCYKQAYKSCDWNLWGKWVWVSPMTF